MKRALKYLLLLIMCAILAFHGFACSRDGYKQITVKSELCHYFFEYSGYYEADGPHTDLDLIIPYTDLSLVKPEISGKAEVIDFASGEIKSVIGHYSPGSISVHVYDASEYESAPKTSRERLERTITGKASWANFKLLERSPLTVSGVEGEMIEYLVDKLMPIPVEDSKNLEYFRVVYFDYNGLIWVIEAKCDQEIREQVRADFDHIIQTFIILE